MKLYPNITAIFCIWALTVFVIFYFAFSTIPTQNPQSADFFNRLGNWDGGHYLSIAQFGYEEKFQYAFFPLYPLLIKAVYFVTQNYLLASLLISIISSFLAIQLLFDLIRLDFDKKIAERVVFVLLMFPTSFYFLIAYSEGLFFLLTITTFLFARKGNLLIATTAAALASATRPFGLAVVLGLISYIYFTKGINKKNWFVFLSSLGLVFYSAYLYSKMGDPFYFIQAQTHWHASFSIPGAAIIHTFKKLISPNYLVNNFRDFLDFIFVIFGITMVYKVWRRLSIDYAIYSTISLIMPLFSPTIASVPRFLLTIFPIFVMLGLSKNQYLGIFYQLFSPMLLAIFAVLFINGYWSN